MNGACKKCAIGFYKNNSVSHLAQLDPCQPCDPYFITAGTGSQDVAFCNIGKCSSVPSVKQNLLNKKEKQICYNMYSFSTKELFEN